MDRGDQGQLLRWTLRALDGQDSPWPFPDGDLARFRRAVFSSGLGALVHWLVPPLYLGDEVRAYLADQHDQCRARSLRFATVGSLCLDALDAAGIPAIAVKGPVMGANWPQPSLRPMADLDFIVRPEQLAVASDALSAAGFPVLRSTPWETAHQAWGGREPLRTDGESIDHPGSIELHPGWVERAHHYLVAGPNLFSRAIVGTLGDAPCWRLPRVLETAHALGHLSVAAVRGEARAVGVVDVVLSMVPLNGAERTELWRWGAEADPRLVAPGAWLVEQQRPGTLPTGFVEMTLTRLGRRGAASLRSTGPDGLWRRPGRPSTLRWRHSFASGWSEHVRVTRQAVWPPTSDRSSARHVLGQRLGSLRGGRSHRPE